MIDNSPRAAASRVRATGASAKPIPARSAGRQSRASVRRAKCWYRPRIGPGDRCGSSAATTACTALPSGSDSRMRSASFILPGRRRARRNRPTAPTVPSADRPKHPTAGAAGEVAAHRLSHHAEADESDGGDRTKRSSHLVSVWLGPAGSTPARSPAAVTLRREPGLTARYPQGQVFLAVTRNCERDSAAQKPGKLFACI